MAMVSATAMANEKRKSNMAASRRGGGAMVVALYIDKTSIAIGIDEDMAARLGMSPGDFVDLCVEPRTRTGILMKTPEGQQFGRKLSIYPGQGIKAWARFPYDASCMPDNLPTTKTDVTKKTILNTTPASVHFIFPEAAPDNGQPQIPLAMTGLAE